MLGLLVLILLIPLNLLLRQRPEDVGLAPDGERHSSRSVARAAKSNIADLQWATVDWTLARAFRTARFWWIAVGYFCGMIAWYAVQVHQTKYLLDLGFSSAKAAWALGLVALVAIPGQIVLGHVSDRVGREWVWTVGCFGFAVCYVALLLLREAPTPALLYVMVVSQGFLGYGMVSVIGAIPAEIFEGAHYGSIFGTVMLAAIAGGAVGPWVTGLLYDVSGSYAPAFWAALGCCALSAIAIWCAAPGRVRAVAGRARSH
jgi:MFS family permease